MRQETIATQSCFSVFMSADLPVSQAVRPAASLAAMGDVTAALIGVELLHDFSYALTKGVEQYARDTV